MLILDPSTDPAFNLAAEEFLLKEVDVPVIRLWRSDPCVVMGRHQNPHEEVNLPVARARGLPVLRRLSGGGTVYHDPGNINFTFVTPVADNRQVDFRRALTPVVAALLALDVPVQFSRKSDLIVHGRKISGNAIYMWQHRCLHHGTLLYDADLDALETVLRVPEAGYTSRSIKSVRSRVANIREVLPHAPRVDAFMVALAQRLAIAAGEASTAREFRGEERRRIAEIQATVYDTWDWNFGHAPRYELRRKLADARGRTVADVRLVVEHGRVVEATFEGGPAALSAAARRLHGVPHHTPDLRAALVLHEAALSAAGMDVDAIATTLCT